jgi:hypothetical protein
MTQSSIHSFINVFHEELGSDWSELLEATYLRRFFKSLRELMGESFEQFRFLIINKNSRWSRIAPQIRGEDVVLIWLGDEEGTIPHELSRDFRLILKSYWPISESVGNIHPFPLCGSSAVLERDPIPFEKRSTNVFFSGNLNANRVDFYRQFIPWGGIPAGNLPFLVRKLIARGLGTRPGRLMPRDFSASFPASVISFTGGFAQGYPPREFAKRLSDAKIAICPPGFTSNETIRHFEAMSHGCVILSSKLPKNFMYQASPVTEIENWSTLYSVLTDMINKPSRLAEISQSTYEWWDRVLSSKAMAIRTTRLLTSNN